MPLDTNQALTKSFSLCGFEKNVFAHAWSITFFARLTRLVLVRHCTKVGTKELEITRESDLSRTIYAPDIF